jgi:colanic acid/amylovoran biosynthesis protein
MAKSAIPQILLDTGDYRCGNLGDVAMLQVAVSRLKELWPSAVVHVLTEDAAALAKHCPSAEPLPCVGRDAWFSERNLLGRVHVLLPGVVSNQLVKSKNAIRRRWPAGLEMMLRGRARMRGASSDEIRSFLGTASAADLVALSGAGGMTDQTRAWSMGFLNLLEMANCRGTPTAMFGHGFGRVRDTELLARAKPILSRVALLCLRESQNGPPLLESLGVHPSRWSVTGDDAIEPAYEARPMALGSALGVNVRIGARAGVERAALDGVRPVIRRFAETRGVSLVGLPITVPPSKCDDSSTIREFLGDGADAAGNLAPIDTPRKVMEQVSRCRLVVSGAFHGAVFALSEGVAAVCLGKGDYVLDKFRGLADQFGGGLVIVDLDTVDFPAQLDAQIQNMWEAAPSWRAALLDSAARQIAAGRGAYRRLKEIVRDAHSAPSQFGN